MERPDSCVADVPAGALLRYWVLNTAEGGQRSEALAD
jgi:hypothetical protein